MSETFHGNAGSTSKSKISYFEDVIFRDEQILRFEVTMEDLFIMAMANTSQKLVCETFDDERIHSLLFIEIVHEFLEVIVEIFEDKYKLFVGMYDLT